MHVQGLSAVVFPVTQSDEKTTTVRPCSDSRRLNSASPTISETTKSVADAVIALRTSLKPGHEIRQYDLAKAFYKIKIRITDIDGERYHPVLKVGQNRFTSERLVFGLSCGPAGLNASQDIINWIIDRTISDISYSKIIVMDDYLLAGDSADLNKVENLLDYTWNKTGFESPKSKRQTWSDTPTRWLGGHWSWDGEKLRIKRKPIDAPTIEKWTKRKAFEVAGKFTAVTASLDETIARLHCDAIRALTGTIASWNDIITDKTLIKELKHHVEAAVQHHSRCLNETVELLSETKDITIQTDASNSGFGAVILQNKHIVYAWGKLFSTAQQLHHINRKELFAIAQAVQQTDHIVSLMSEIRSVQLETDSKVASLQLNEYKSYNSKSIEKRVLQRLRHNIIEGWNRWRRLGINVSHRHIPGDTNKADGLTRIGTTNIDVCVTEIDTMADLIQIPAYEEWKNTGGNNFSEFIKHSQSEDEKTQKLVEYSPHVTTGADGIIRKKHAVVLPDTLTQQFINAIHVQIGNGSIRDTLINFNQDYWNAHARKIAKQTVRKCTYCQQSNAKVNEQASYGPVNRPEYPFQVIGIDLYGPLPDGKSYILTIVDRLTGYTNFKVLPDSTSGAICKNLEVWLLAAGERVQRIISDNGTQFTASDKFQALLQLWNIKHSTIPIYTPQVGGFYENKHRHATHVIRTMLLQHKQVDLQLLASIASAQINSRRSPDRATTPHELIYGYQYSWPLGTAATNSAINQDEQLNPPDPAVVETAQKQHKMLREKFLKLLEHEFEVRQEKQAERFTKENPRTKRPLKVGDTVMFGTDIIKSKFAPQCSGPFRIAEQLGKHSFKVIEEETQKSFILHAKRLRRIEDTRDEETERVKHGYNLRSRPGHQ